MGMFTEHEPEYLEYLEEKARKKINLVYLIEKISIDPSENIPCNAVEYSPFGFTLDEEMAKNFCEKGRQYTDKDCWAIMDTMPEYRYKPIKQIR